MKQQQSDVSIFHTLAEKAFNRVYFSGIGSDLRNLNLMDQNGFWNLYYLQDPLDFYDELNSEEQSLALLFIGEMYEDSQS
jgi:hypothetical protein